MSWATIIPWALLALATAELVAVTLILKANRSLNERINRGIEEWNAAMEEERAAIWPPTP